MNTVHRAGGDPAGRGRETGVGPGMPLLVLVSGILATAGVFLGSGALGGTPIAQAAGGWLNEDSTPLAPAAGAFRIWSVIYLGLLAYSVWQLLPAQRRSARHRWLRGWAVAAMLLNAAWIWTVQLGWLTLSLVVIVALLAVLGRILHLLVRTGSVGRVDALVTDGTFGLYLGWVTIATVANASAVLAAAGVHGDRLPGWLPVWVLAALVLAAAALIGVATARRSGGRMAPALALAWGLAWITVGRLDGGLQSPGTAVAAGIAAAVVLVSAVVFRVAAARQ